MASYYDKRYNYEQVKAICEVFKHNKELCWDYEDVISVGLQYYDEWVKLARNKEKGNGKGVKNKYGNVVQFLDNSEYAYSQDYVARRVVEDYLE